jgi:uncharacterized protein YicC (UPF0701 family)
MTGFARRERSGPFGTLVCELRSVNHRFLDATLRLPDNCRALEPELRQAIARELKRGKVDCTLQQRAQSNAAASLDIDQAALERLLGRLQELEAALPGRAQIDLIELLRWPGIVRDELARARAREGARLAELIEQRCATLHALIAAVRARLPAAQAQTRERFLERLRDLGAQADQDRIEQEILLMLQRFDVSEELDRLSGHIEETRRTLGGAEPAGRRLDFLLQEFNREANTLSSKSQDLETTRVAVEMKVLIEQMREQVQNIE